MLVEHPQDFIFNSSIGIHAVSPDGFVVYANHCELHMLGYDLDEYVGHHVSEFQMDKECLADMMIRLSKFESLKNYPAQVKSKTGIKYIIYNSSAYSKGGEFVYSRCYGTEVDKEIYDVYYRSWLKQKESIA